MKVMFSDLGECIVFAIIFLIICAGFNEMVAMFC